MERVQTPAHSSLSPRMFLLHACSFAMRRRGRVDESSVARRFDARGAKLRLEGGQRSVLPNMTAAR